MILPPDFHIFGPQHLAALGVLAILSLLVAHLSGKLPAPGRQWLGRSIGFLLAAYVLTFYIQQGIAGSLSWDYSLPLDLCSLVLAAGILSLFRPARFICEITYFWGAGGSLQALLTPDLGSGFPSWDFALFFWGHGAILLGIVFIVSGTGFRPDRKSILRMMISLNIYAIAVGTINWFMGWNYGYLCWKPYAPSLMDVLGPWPWYLLSLEGVALLTFILLALPWKIGGHNTCV